MSKKKIITLSTFGVSLLMLASCLGNASGNKEYHDGWNLPNVPDVELGDKVTFDKAVYKDVNGTFYATTVVVFPDGSEKMGEEIEFTLPGQYTIRHTVEEGGKIHCNETITFVDYQQYSISNKEKSSIKYIDTQHLSEIRSEKTPGALISLAYGDTLTFSNPIYLNDLTSEHALLKGFIVPSSDGAADFSIITFTLSNPDNPDNFVKIRYYSHIETNTDGLVSHSSSVTARSDAVGVFAGVHQSQGLHTNDTYGLWSGVCFDGYVQPSYKSTYLDNCLFCIGYDDTTKQTYGTGFGKGATLDPVLDLDDATQVRKAWGGFTSDRVLLSINCESYSSSTANFVITELFGCSASDFVSNKFVDDGYPEITVDSKYQNLPDGAIGYSYPIPTATAYDQICLDCPVTSEVYYNYFDEVNRYKVKIEDGKFKMDRPGVYTILYSAKDYSANISNLAVSVKVFDSIDKPDFDLPSHSDTMPVCNFVTTDRNITIKGGCGETNLKIYYETPTINKTLVEGDGFRLTTLETYRVTYEVTDMIGQVTTKTYEVTATENTKHVQGEIVTFPRYLISEGYYQVPDVKIFSFENGKVVENHASLLVTDSNGTKTYKYGEEYKPVVTNSGDSVKLQIVFGDEKFQSQDIVTIKSLGKPDKPTALNLENYFIHNSCETLLRPNSTIYPDDKVKGIQFTNTSSDAFNFDFANYLLSNNFSITLSSILEAKAGTTIKFILTDYTDASIAVSASLTYDGTDTYLVVGDKKERLIDNPFNKQDNNYYLTFDGMSFACSQSSSLTVTKTENGEDFEGFASPKANLSVEVNNATATTNFVVNDLCGQVFSSTSSRDRTSPIIYLPVEVGGTYQLNDVYRIYPAYSSDVLSPNIVFTLTVLDAKGNPAKDINGVSLLKVDPTKTYDVVLSEYGVYSFEYTTAEDSRFVGSVNSYTIQRQVYVYDDVKPTIVMSETFPSELKVNDIVRFPKFTYSDNVTATDKLTVQRIYIDPNGKYHYLASSDTEIKFSIVGTYKIMINVMDEAGNIANETMYVNVTK